MCCAAATAWPTRSSTRFFFSTHRRRGMDARRWPLICSLLLLGTGACAIGRGSRAEPYVAGLQPKSPGIALDDATSFVVTNDARPVFEWEALSALHDQDRDSGWIARTKNVT